MYIMTAGYYCLEKENQKGRSYMQCVCVCPSRNSVLVNSCD